MRYRQTKAGWVHFISPFKTEQRNWFLLFSWGKIVWSSLGNMNEAKWCYLGIMNFYLNEGMNIASKRKQVYHLVKPKYILKNKDMLAIQCKTFLMTAYYNDSCNFKMSIDFCLLNAWLICLIISFAYSQFYCSWFFFFQISNDELVLNTVKYIILC